jgi:hypothetical protein
VKTLLFITTLLASFVAQGADLVTHNSVLIKADAATIWPRVVEPGEWKQGAQLVAIDDTNMVFHAVMPDNPDQPLFLVVTTEFVPDARRTIRLSALDGSLMGYASWRLQPVDGDTLVTYDVYSYAAALPEGLSEGQYVKMNRDRFQAELEGLKALIEGAE